MGSNYILVPSDRLVNDLRNEYIPSLIEIVKQESQWGSQHTLGDLLEFLFLYQEITGNDSNMNMEKELENSHVIRMLPILVEIAEKLLKGNERYKEQSTDFKQILRYKGNKSNESKHFTSMLVSKIERAYTKIINFDLNTEESKK